MIASDETSVRVMRKTQWEWVFVAAFAVLQVIRPSRGADVVREVFGAIARGFGCPTVGPPSAAMPIYGKCVWPTMPTSLLCRPVPGNRHRRR